MIIDELYVSLRIIHFILNVFSLQGFSFDKHGNLIKPNKKSRIISIILIIATTIWFVCSTCHTINKNGVPDYSWVQTVLLYISFCVQLYYTSRTDYLFTVIQNINIFDRKLKIKTRKSAKFLIIKISYIFIVCLTIFNAPQVWKSKYFSTKLSFKITHLYTIIFRCVLNLSVLRFVYYLINIELRFNEVNYNLDHRYQEFRLRTSVYVVEKSKNIKVYGNSLKGILPA